MVFCKSEYQLFTYDYWSLLDEQEYFSKSVGFVKKVSLQYNQNGISRGIADIIFGKPGLAAKAAKDLNGMLVDKRPMKASYSCGDLNTKF